MNVFVLPLDVRAAPRQTAPPTARAKGWRMKLSTAVAEFVKDTRMAKSPKTADAYGTDLGYLVRLAKLDAVGEFNETLLTAVFTLLQDRKLSGNTLYRKSTAYREFAKWGLRKGLWLRDPTTDPKFRFQLRRGVPRPFVSLSSENVMLTGP